MSEPIVFLPGVLNDARLFGPQLAELSADHAVMTLPMGTVNTIGALADLVLAKSPDRLALVGAGLGGVVAMEVVRRAPERIQRLALISTSPLCAVPFDAMAYEPMLVAARSGRMEEVVETLIGQGARPTHPEVLALVQDMALAIGVDRFVNQVRAIQRQRDMQSTLRKIKCPTVVLHGAEDPLLASKRHETMVGFISDAQLVTVPNAGTLPTLENPAVVTDALKEWMARPLRLA